MTTSTKAREELITQRDTLKERLEKIKQDFSKGLDADSEERAVQLENADVLNEIARTSEQALIQVEKEIARLDKEAKLLK